jgi:hypothetical protein
MSPHNMPRLAQTAPRGIALLTPHHGARWEGIFRAMPQQLNPWERALAPNVDEAGWAPGQVWKDMEKTKSLAPNEFQTLDCIAHNKSQYQLHYPGIHFNYQLT